MYNSLQIALDSYLSWYKNHAGRRNGIIKLEDDSSDDNLDPGSARTRIKNSKKPRQCSPDKIFSELPHSEMPPSAVQPTGREPDISISSMTAAPAPASGQANASNPPQALILHPKRNLTVLPFQPQLISSPASVAGSASTNLGLSGQVNKGPADELFTAPCKQRVETLDTNDASQNTNSETFHTNRASSEIQTSQQASEEVNNLQKDSDSPAMTGQQTEETHGTVGERHDSTGAQSGEHVTGVSQQVTEQQTLLKDTSKNES
ncbi:hypothetical protein EWM64_g4452 [Hericium alpestre]|uniref:Uncharacterized protein n=1 Tax=Hericium alpestre TaxID=135208 RepID=A0A4Z0A182_9AGAM|nr:hypothetical protein EWM64_g4452 [Hericium alpestre]